MATVATALTGMVGSPQLMTIVVPFLALIAGHHVRKPGQPEGARRRRLRPEPVRARRVIVWYACALHYIWGILLAVSPAAMHSTPVSAIVAVFGGRWGAMAALLAVAAAAHAGSLARRRWMLPALLVPQQTLLLISAGAALYAAAAGHYADGVPGRGLSSSATSCPSSSRRSCTQPHC